MYSTFRDTVDSRVNEDQHAANSSTWLALHDAVRNTCHRSPWLAEQWSWLV